MPFDEAFPLAAGEDRDWCAGSRRPAGHRASAGGTREPPPGPDLRRFWRQQRALRRGARATGRAAAGAATAGCLLRRLLGRAFRQGPAVGRAGRGRAAGDHGAVGAGRAQRAASEQGLAGHVHRVVAGEGDRGGGDVLEPRRPAERRGGRVPGTTRAQASPSVWLPERPLPTPWRSTVP